MPTLRQIVFASPAQTEEEGLLLGRRDPPLSGEGHAQARELARWTPPVDLAIAPPTRRGWTTAALLARGRTVRLDPRLHGAALGAWEGRSREELARAEPIWFPDWEARSPLMAPLGGESWAAVRERVREAVRSLGSLPVWSALVVADPEILQILIEELTGRALPDGRPHRSELGLLTRRDGAWRPGRRSSEPEALRSPLERVGLSGLLPIALSGAKPGSPPSEDPRRGSIAG